jgi:hypothetical protein
MIFELKRGAEPQARTAMRRGLRWTFELKRGAEPQARTAMRRGLS